MPEISGSTQLLPIIGRPIIQVKAPEAFNTFFARENIDAVCAPLGLDDAGADAFIRAIRGAMNAPGFIATIPFKQRSAAACDELSDRAAFLGATNLIRRNPDGRLIGDMTDGIGCVTAMRRHGVEPTGKSAVVIGAGGAGSAIAHALAEAGVVSLGLSDLDSSRADRLAGRLQAAFPAVAISSGRRGDLAGVNIAVNASPVGMNDDPNLPMAVDGLSAGALVADVVTNPTETPWLRAAKAAACVTQTGREMVEGQFELMAKHFGFS